MVKRPALLVERAADVSRPDVIAVLRGVCPVRIANSVSAIGVRGWYGRTEKMWLRKLGALARVGLGTALSMFAGCAGVEVQTRGSFPEFGYFAVEAPSQQMAELVKRALVMEGFRTVDSPLEATHTVRMGVGAKSKPTGAGSGSSGGLQGGNTAYNHQTGHSGMWFGIDLDPGPASGAEPAHFEDDEPLVTVSLSVRSQRTGDESWSGTARGHVSGWGDRQTSRQWTLRAVRQLVRTGSGASDASRDGQR